MQPPATSPSATVRIAAEPATAAPAPAPPSPEAAPRRKLPLWAEIAALVVLLSTQALFIACHYAPAISHPDANGYWAQGTLLVHTGQTLLRPESPAQYIGMHWLVTDSGAYACRYPPGLSYVVALVSWLVSPEASVLINPVFAILTLLGVFLLTRALTGPGWGLLTVLALGLNPVFNAHALSSISHMTVALLLVWGSFLLVRWTRTGSLSAIFGAGLLLGCIPTVRYPETLCAVGVAAFLLCHWRRRERMWLHALVALAGALIPVIHLMIRNQQIFGAFWRTAYDLTNEQTGFGQNYFQQHWLQYIQGLLGDGMGVLLPLAIIGLALMVALPAKAENAGAAPTPAPLHARPFGLLAALCTVLMLLLYMAYYWGGAGGGGDGNLRFLLPLFPFLCVAAVWALWRLTSGLALAARAAAVGALFAVYALWSVPTVLQASRATAYQHRVLARVTAALRRDVPAGAVVMADSNLLQHLDFIRLWRLTDPGLLTGRMQGMGMMRENADETAPRPMQAKKREVQMSRYQGLSRQELRQTVVKDLQAWSPDGALYVVGTEDDVRTRLAAPLFDPQKIEIIARLDLPDPPATPAWQSQRMGVGGRNARGAMNANRQALRRPDRGARDAADPAADRPTFPDGGMMPPQPPMQGGMMAGGPGGGRGFPGAPDMAAGGGMPAGGPAGFARGGGMPFGGMGRGSFLGAKTLVIAKYRF